MQYDLVSVLEQNILTVCCGTLHNEQPIHSAQGQCLCTPYKLVFKAINTEKILKAPEKQESTKLLAEWTKNLQATANYTTNM